MSDQLIEQLKKLKGVKPSREWVTSSRDFVLSEIRADRYAEINMDGIEKRGFAYKIRAIKLAWKPVGVFAMMALLLFGGSGLTVIAAQSAVPGDSLFAVKKIVERSQGMVATDNSHRVELATRFTSNRVDELQKVIVQETQLVSADGSERRSEKVLLAASEVKRQLDDVSARFSELKNGNSNDSKKTAVAALVLNDKIRTYRAELRQAREKATTEEVENELDSALDAVEEISTNVLEAIVDGHMDGELELEVSDIEDKLEEHVAVIEEKVAEVEEVLAQKFETDGIEYKEKATQAKEKIAKAKEAINTNEFDLVLTLSRDSNKILEMLYGDIYSVEVVVPEVEGDEGRVEGDSDEMDIQEGQEDVVVEIVPEVVIPVEDEVEVEEEVTEEEVEVEEVEPEGGYQVGI
jgi:hypothetical protein